MVPTRPSVRPSVRPFRGPVYVCIHVYTRRKKKKHAHKNFYLVITTSSRVLCRVLYRSQCERRKEDDDDNDDQVVGDRDSPSSGGDDDGRTGSGKPTGGAVRPRGSPGRVRVLLLRGGGRLRLLETEGAQIRGQGGQVERGHRGRGWVQDRSDGGGEDQVRGCKWRESERV